MFVTSVEFGTPAYDATVDLRWRLLRIPLGLAFSPADFKDEYLDFHLACFSDDYELLACMVLTSIDEKTVRMRQVAVVEKYQGKGIGSFFVQESETFARQQGFESIMCHARDTAVAFYKRLGYEIYGEPFTEVTIEHFRMRKKL